MRFLNMEFVHPLTLWEMFTQKDKRHEYYSFFSYLMPTGKDAYDKASTPAEKFDFFYSYLCKYAVEMAEEKNSAVLYKTQSEENMERLYKLALTMLLTAKDTEMSFDEYYDMMDPEKNILVRAATDIHAEGCELLSMLHEGTDSEVYRTPKTNCLEHLTVYEEGKTPEELYRLEKIITAVFFDDDYSISAPPHCYNFDAYLSS